MEIQTNWGRVKLPAAKIENLKNQEVIVAFTCGHCHSFALAVHELTGWQLVGLYLGYCSIADTPDHVVVRMPNGKLLDITGIDNVDRYTKSRDFTKEEVENFYDYRNPVVKKVIPFGKALLRSIGVIPTTKSRWSRKTEQLKFSF